MKINLTWKAITPKYGMFYPTSYAEKHSTEGSIIFYVVTRRICNDYYAHFSILNTIVEESCEKELIDILTKKMDKAVNDIEKQKTTIYIDGVPATMSSLICMNSQDGRE